MEIVLISREKTTKVKKDHPCLDGIDLSVLPLGRIGRAAALLERGAEKEVLRSSQIGKPFFLRHKGKLYRESGTKNYYTVLKDTDDLIIYRVVEVYEHDMWTIKEKNGVEFLIRKYNTEEAVGYNAETGYCEKFKFMEE